MTRQHTMNGMDLTLNRFVHALRAADVAVSPAETLDALEIMQQVGLGNRQLLQDALRLALAKTQAEKEAFDSCFQAFFTGLAPAGGLRQSVLRSVESTQFLQRVHDLAGPELAETVAWLIEGDVTRLTRRLFAAVDRQGLDGMRHLRDKAVLVDDAARVLGLSQLDALQTLGGNMATAARHVQGVLRQQLKAHVDLQYRLIVDATGQRALLAAALSANLQQVPPGYYLEVERVVDRLADRLVRRQRTRQRRTQRGQLDLRRMLRQNMAFEGVPIKISWRQQRREQATVFMVCDISNSVAAIARFALLLMYKLGEVLPQVRSFAFSSRLGEITSLMRGRSHQVAIESAIEQLGRGTTDYGQAMHDLHQLVARDVNRKSVLVFLGDARSNHFPARAELFMGMARQAGETWWLTPEPPDRRHTGDSVLHEYAPHCRAVLTCNRLADIERFAEKLLTITHQVGR